MMRTPQATIVKTQLTATSKKNNWAGSSKPRCVAVEQDSHRKVE